MINDEEKDDLFDLSESTYQMQGSANAYQI